MSKISAFCISVASMALAFSACNSSSNYEPEELSSSVLVKSFSLSANDKVLANLENVFFSIDLASGNIFNADSMPYGTDIHALVPVITVNSCSSLELIVHRPELGDTTYNYLTNSTDSINFSYGPVTLRIKSVNELVTKDYTINVNVHKLKTDSLTWGDMAYSKLPTNLSDIAMQHTVKFGGKAYCMTTDFTNYCMAVCDNPASREWTITDVNLDFKPMVETLRSTSDAIYILDENHDLYRSTDGLNWSATSQKFDYLIGGYGNQLIGTVRDDGKWSIASTTGYKTQAPTDFPVTGASTPIVYTFPMSDAIQMTITGGRTATGDLVAGSWGFDGSNWAYLTTKTMNDAVEDLTVFPYFVYDENEYFVATEYSVFVALGGRKADGLNNDTTYISYDYGMNWRKASELMQLPKEVKPKADAQALIFISDISARSAVAQWSPITLPAIPANRMIASHMPMVSRASTEITAWQCPYIYVFGGEDEDGKTSDTVWRAVINRLTFKPLQ